MEMVTPDVVGCCKCGMRYSRDNGECSAGHTVGEISMLTHLFRPGDNVGVKLSVLTI